MASRTVHNWDPAQVYPRLHAQEQIRFLLGRPNPRNHLLAALPAEVFDELQPCLKRVHLSRGDVLFRPDQLIEDVYFLEDSIASIVAVSPDGNRVEGGMVGCEGLCGVPVMLDCERAAWEIVIHVPGNGYRASASRVCAIAGRKPALRGRLLRYAQFLLVQMAHTALSNAVHPVDVRLARWILMCHDRSAGDDIPLTHKFMAVMLAVQRPTVTVTLHVLEGMGFIRSTRGLVSIRDRAGLEEFARDSYGIPEAEYRKLFGTSIGSTA